jgi:hypothetical protein
MIEQEKEIEKNVWATVEVCPACKEEWIGGEEYDRILDESRDARRRAVMAGMVQDWMIKTWGERCADFDEGCVLCKAWASFDYLFQDPDDILTEEDKKDIAEAVDDIKAGRVHPAEEVYRELGLGKKKVE